MKPQVRAGYETRADLIQAARLRKSAAIEVPDDAPGDSWLTSLTRSLKDRFARLNDREGWEFAWGGVPTGSGVALGVDHEISESEGGLPLAISIRGSQKRFYSVQAAFPLARFWQNRAFLEIGAERRDFPVLDYFGPGPDSSKDNRTAYRFEDASVALSAGLAPTRHLRLGVSGGSEWVNVGPPSHGDFPPANSLFANNTAPGITEQPRYLNMGAFAEWDFRDNADSPRNGGLYSFRYGRLSDRDFGQYSFRRFDTEFQQYFSFVNNRRTILVRARFSATRPLANNIVPFYLRPTLGGAYDLRGFPSYRFTDRTLLLMSTEYRWVATAGLDLALFADAGEVFPAWSEARWRNLETSYGIGFRFNARDNVFARVDVAVSRNGPQIWFRLEDAF